MKEIPLVIVVEFTTVKWFFKKISGLKLKDQFINLLSSLQIWRIFTIHITEKELLKYLIYKTYTIYPCINWALRLRYTDIPKNKINGQQTIYNSGNTNGKMAENIWENVKL